VCDPRSSATEHDREVRHHALQKAAALARDKARRLEDQIEELRRDEEQEEVDLARAQKDALSALSEELYALAEKALTPEPPEEPEADIGF
jgi:hypothetical protein